MRPAVPGVSRTKTRHILRSLAAGLLISACHGAPDEVPRAVPDEPPNLVLISIDTLRADHTSLYGYERETTPNLSRLAWESAWFDVAYSVTSATAPSHATLLTGLHPMDHGVRKNAMVLPSRHRTLAEVLAERSYQTGAMVSSFILDRRFGWEQGFEQYDDDFELSQAKIQDIGATVYHDMGVEGGFDRRAEFTNRHAIRWLQQVDADRPFFLFLHYFDPHEPYEAPQPFDRIFPIPSDAPDPVQQKAAYDREIAHVDSALGFLLTYLRQSGLADDTLIVVTADHGQGLMDYGYRSHGPQIYEGQVRVPMVFHWPSRISPRRFSAAPVSWLDVMPTLLGLLGVESDLPGRDLSALLTGQGRAESPAADRPIELFRQHYTPQVDDGLYVAGEQFGLVVSPWKLIFGPQEKRVELFHLQDDPWETNNLAQAHPDRVESMLAILQPRIDQSMASGIDLDLSDEERKGLEALGYTE